MPRARVARRARGRRRRDGLHGPDRPREPDRRLPGRAARGAAPCGGALPARARSPAGGVRPPGARGGRRDAPAVRGRRAVRATLRRARGAHPGMGRCPPRVDARRGPAARRSRARGALRPGPGAAAARPARASRIPRSAGRPCCPRSGGRRASSSTCCCRCSSCPGSTDEARLAVAAIGEPAVPRLERLLDGARGTRAQSLAANTLAQIGTPSRRAGAPDARPQQRPADAPPRAARAGPGARADGTGRCWRATSRTGSSCASCATTATASTRPSRSNRTPPRRSGCSPRATASPPRWRWSAPCRRWRAGTNPSRSSASSSGSARATGWSPHPRWSSSSTCCRDRSSGTCRKVFEEPAAAGAQADPALDPLAAWIEAAWSSEDGWLRACAVRASRFSPSFDPRRFAAAEDDDPRVRAEIARAAALRRPAPAAAPREATC